jgi:hypothetical protein
VKFVEGADVTTGRFYISHEKADLQQYEENHSFIQHNDLWLDWVVVGSPYRYHDRLPG